MVMNLNVCLAHKEQNKSISEQVHKTFYGAWLNAAQVNFVYRADVIVNAIRTFLAFIFESAIPVNIRIGSFKHHQPPAIEYLNVYTFNITVW